MDEFKDRLYTIKDVQNKLIKEYQELISQYESHDLIHENQTLRQQYEEYKLRLSRLQEKFKQTEEENVQLRTSLTEQIIDEKLNIIKVSREKLNTYFAGNTIAYSNELEAVEHVAKNTLKRILARADAGLLEEKEVIFEKIGQITAELDQRLLAQRERFEEEERSLLHKAHNQLDDLAAEEVDEETIQRRIKQNQIEMKIGLNWINKLGMLLILFGVGAAFKYSYSTWFNGYMKGSAFFCWEQCFWRAENGFTGNKSRPLPWDFSAAVFPFCTGRSFTVIFCFTLSIWLSDYLYPCWSA